MVQTIKAISKPDEKIYVCDTTSISTIKSVLSNYLFVPDLRIKPLIVEKLIEYLQSKFNDKNYKIKFFVAKKHQNITGYIVCQIDNEYKSYSRKCATFGWVYFQDFESCKAIMDSCEEFVSKHRIRKMRGPINFPTYIGGIGWQIYGFHNPIIAGVAFSDPQSKALEYLQQLGYKIESKYTCVYVTESAWKKGNKLDPSIKLEFRNVEGIRKLKPRIIEIAQNSFHSVLADAPGGETKFDTIMKTYDSVPEEYYRLPPDIDLKSYFRIPEFIEAVEDCNFERVVHSAPLAFDRETGKLVGLIFALPDLFQIWSGEYPTHLNVDTAMIDKNYTARGIFSSLNNIGQLACKLSGFHYFEGTTIWSNNDRAIKTIFPHSIPIRKHVVVQKRI
ncbi:MAG: hypothetical protein ACFFD5_11525 [Candidatus Thorarchaeota archaeon]